MATAKQCAALAREVIEAYNAHDLDRVEALFADDSETLTVPTGEHAHGKGGARQDTERWLTAFPDMRLEVVDIAAGQDCATVEARVLGTNTGKLATPDGELEPTGKHVEQPLCMVLRFKDGTVASEHDYFDLAGMLEQLGLGRGEAWAPPSPS